MPVATALATGTSTGDSRSAVLPLSRGRLTSLSASFQTGINDNNNTFAQVGIQFEVSPDAYVKIPLAEGYVSARQGINWTGSITIEGNMRLFLNIQSQFSNQVAMTATTEVD